MEILDDIINNSADCILENYSYSSGGLIVYLDLVELDKKVQMKIKTDSLSFNNFYLEKKEEMFRTCRLEIQNLEYILDVKNGIYVPSTDFGELMNETRSNYNLAYGKKSSELKFLFSLIGYDSLISCLLSDLTQIIIE